MIKQIDYGYRYILARGKEITTNEEVVGLVFIDEYSPRETFTTLLTIDHNDYVTVDPVTVELFTGLRCPVSGKRIFEGDFIQLHSPIFATIVADNCDFVYDYCGEICMPLNIVKAGARKRLYLSKTLDTPDAGSTEGFYQTSSQWDAMEWVILGRTSIENETPHDHEEKMADTILEHHGLAVYPKVEETMAFTRFCKSCEIWNVTYGKDWGDRPLFGTFHRRAHILRRLKEFFDGKKGVSFGDDLYHHKFDHLRLKWAADYQKYVVEPEAYCKLMDEKRMKREMRQLRAQIKRDREEEKRNQGNR